MKEKTKVEFQSTMAFLIILMGCIGFSMLITPHSEKRSENAQKWARFEKCVNDFPSDAVCDSCYQEIFKSK